ncbi:MAG: hypothetical protein QM479_01895 [Pseudomonadota bacterium]
MFTEILVDVSDLEAPEPFTEVLSVLTKLQKKAYIRMLHRQQPFPLYDVLRENNLDYCVFEPTSLHTKYTILIWLAADIETAKHCHQLV